MSVDDATKYIADKQFNEGGMLPKVEAAVSFASSSKEHKAIITSIDTALEGISGKTGTDYHLLRVTQHINKNTIYSFSYEYMVFYFYFMMLGSKVFCPWHHFITDSLQPHILFRLLPIFHQDFFHLPEPCLDDRRRHLRRVLRFP